jgi:hypothetical protein
VPGIAVIGIAVRGTIDAVGGTCMAAYCLHKTFNELRKISFQDCYRLRTLEKNALRPNFKPAKNCKCIPIENSSIG